MDYQTFLTRMPKAELHCHLAGTMRAPTLVDLAQKNGIPLPTTDPWRLFEVPNVNFFAIYGLLCRAMMDEDDFARVTYESLREGVETANLRYREMFFSPTAHFAQGVSYATQLDGIVEGLRAAEQDFGVRCALIPSIDRAEGPEAAVELVRHVIDDRRVEVIGIGLDGQEALGHPEAFAEAYAMARQAGLHRTAHTCEDGPPKNAVTCLDVLGCERLDHGYWILEDPAVVQRARDDGVFFNVKSHLITDWRRHPVREMIRQGLKVTLNSDDPAIHHTNLAMEYIDTASAFGFDAGKMRELCLSGLDAAWLDDADRRSLRTAFCEEIDRLEADLDDGSAPEFVSYYGGKWWAEPESGARS